MVIDTPSRLVWGEKVALLQNPKAGLRTADQAEREALRAAFRSVGEVVDCSSHSQLRKQLETWRESELNLLALYGGDGTFHVVLRELLSVWKGAPLPALFFLHGGTVGDVSSSLGSRAPWAAAGWIARRIAAGLPLPGRTFRALDVGGTPAFNCGVGIFAAVPDWVATRMKGGQGIGAASGRAVAHVLIGTAEGRKLARGYDGWLSIDGRMVQGPWVGLLALAIDHVAGMPIVSPAREASQFRLFACRGDARQLLPAARRLARTGQLQGNGLEAILARRLEIFPQHSTRIMSDGEAYEHEGPLTIAPGPEWVVVQPPLELSGPSPSLPTALSWLTGSRRGLDFLPKAADCGA